MTTTADTQVVTTAAVASHTSTMPEHHLWGIDTVRLSFPIDISKVDRNPEHWMGHTSNQGKIGEPAFVTLRDKLNIYGVDVQVFVYTSRSICHLEFNASRFLNEDRLYLLPPHLLKEKIERALSELAIKVQPRFLHIDESTGEVQLMKGWDSIVKFKRLDVARNIECSNPDAILHQLMTVATSNGSDLHIHIGKGGWTVRHSTASVGQDKIYNKSAEMRYNYVQSMSWEKPYLRFETELKGDRLVRHGLTHVNDITRDKVKSALDTRWKSSGFNNPTPSMDEIITKTEGMPYPQRAKAVGHTYLKNNGVSGGLTRRQEKRWDSRLSF